MTRNKLTVKTMNDTSTNMNCLERSRGTRRKTRVIRQYCLAKYCLLVATAAILRLANPIAGFLIQPDHTALRSAGRSVSTSISFRIRSGPPSKLFYSNSTSSEMSLSMNDVVHTSKRPSGFKVYCDMDGVLVDFEKGVFNLLQTGTSNLDKRTMWNSISRIPNWFEKLEWKQDGRRLWQAIKHLQPDILTGVPNIQTSCVDKYNWCKRELQLLDAHHVDMAADGKSCAHESINGNQPREDATNVITCWSTNKYRECKKGSVLIDDRIDLKANWEAAGGIFIHHINTETTLHKLREHGILPEELEGEEWYWEGSWRLWRI